MDPSQKLKRILMNFLCPSFEVIIIILALLFATVFGIELINKAFEDRSNS